MANDFFNDLGSSISRATQTAVDKTSSFFGVQKINARLAAEKSKVEKLYAILGESYYAKIADGSLAADEELVDVVAEVAERTERIGSLKADLAAAKGMRLCEDCGNMAGLDDVFCSKCGAKLPDPPVEEPEEDIFEEAAEAAGETADAVEEAAEEAADDAKEAAEEAAEAVEEAIEAAEEAVENSEDD